MYIHISTPKIGGQKISSSSHLSFSKLKKCIHTHTHTHFWYLKFSTNNQILQLSINLCFQIKRDMISLA
ncbi:hypothetical protein QVD17_30964 [Tagetes erecta]|uniref:Uncharacterized protein n=1 Tax=Tagetes erecta TaxID=13708 RepID=A0AAD8K5A6_TARER|nr:hypothetical protein QVD17_30964 [Tagetes erecta]